MTTHADDHATDATAAQAYEPPAVRPLGTLADLTLGGVTAGVPDTYGFSGDEDTFGSNM